MAGTSPDGDRANTPGSDGSKGRRLEDVEEMLKENPFHTPTDEEIFILRDLDRKKRLEERRRNEQLSVQEKKTWASRMSSSSRSVKLDDFIEEAPTATDRRTKKMHGLVSATNAAIAKDRRKEKENMSEFIAKKRDMFLVQMALDTKRAEIRKLEEQASQREEALKKSEALLEEDGVRFDQFLRQSDQKMVESIKRAELETKAKQDKLAEIKKLNMSMAQVKSDMSKFEEALEDCKIYRKFLEDLTPVEWRREHLEKIAQKREARRRAREEERKMVSAKDGVSAESKAEQDKGAGKGKPKPKPPRAPPATAKALGGLGPPQQYGQESLENTVNSAAGEEDELSEEDEMYFKEPHQLLDIFTEYEETNLFLIQNSQETEETLDQLNAKLAEADEQMRAESEQLSQQIKHLNDQIREQEMRAKTLENKGQSQHELPQHGKSGGGGHFGVQPGFDGVVTESDLLHQLNNAVSEVYKQCGFENDAHMSTLEMLGNMEEQLEMLFTVRDKMNIDQVRELERIKGSERRKEVREQKYEELRKMQELKVNRALERAAAPVTKKTGKPLMLRSAPKERKKKEDDKQTKGAEDEDDIKAFFVA